jgi:hypothetical protein
MQQDLMYGSLGRVSQVFLQPILNISASPLPITSERSSFDAKKRKMRLLRFCPVLSKGPVFCSHSLLYLKRFRRHFAIYNSAQIHLDYVYSGNLFARSRSREYDAEFCLIGATSREYGPR